MQIDVVGAILGGLISGAVGGLLSSRFYVRRTLHQSSSDGGITSSGRESQILTGSGSGQVAASKRGAISLTSTTITNLRPAELVVTVERRSHAGGVMQVLHLANSGDETIDDLALGATPDGGGFLTLPDWSQVPTRLAGGQSVRIACATSGADLARLVVQFKVGDRRVGPVVLEIPHR